MYAITVAAAIVFSFCTVRLLQCNAGHYPCIVNSFQRACMTAAARRHSSSGLSRRRSRNCAASSRAISRARISRTISACLNAGMPDWRVPKSSPGPRSSRSAWAMRKPSFVSHMISMRRRISGLTPAFPIKRQCDCAPPRPTRPRS